MSDDFPVRVEQRGADPPGGNAPIWPDRANALSRATLLALGKLTREAVENPSVRAIVITGAGDKAFCAGADLKERQGMSENDVRVQVQSLPTSWTARPVAQPVVVPAMTGGARRGARARLVLRSSDRGFARAAGLAGDTLGIIPGAGGTQRLPRVVGEARARR